MPRSRRSAGPLPLLLMKTFPDLVVCEHCDHVFERVELQRHEVAHCEVCGAVLYRAGRLNLDQWLALTLTAAMIFLLANCYPVIRIQLQGMSREVTLWQSFAAMGHSSAALIAIPSALTVILIPMLQIILLGWVLLFARAGQRAPGFAHAMKLLDSLRPWSMLEVCLLGALVSVIKLSSQVAVVVGVGTWALAALTILLTLIANRDIHWLWELTSEGGK
ncbi:paraquat-inducible protein A [Uliginosibacterium paludis]|uniref:Paraquat-inducible protein A n=1 Tax=Uliginosibacterium paludis TaxID=1615952 RepID=A0ABV2CKV1_9RHOO